MLPSVETLAIIQQMKMIVQFELDVWFECVIEVFSFKSAVKFDRIERPPARYMGRYFL
jgi:hypothetical protein